MKMVKSLLLGAAAGLVAVAGAQAADLPVKAKPVQYVKICSLYGAGFYYIPGTDTCLKVGGWVRYETAYGYNGSFTSLWFNNNLNNRATNENPWRAKGIISFDAREQTEYGTLRSYATLGISTSTVGENQGTANYVNRWFIQWAGFTIGHASSFYDFYNTGANQYGSLGACRIRQTAVGMCSVTPPSSATVSRPRSRPKFNAAARFFWSVRVLALPVPRRFPA